MNGLRPIETGLVALWGFLQYLNGPDMNIRQAALRQGTFTEAAIVIVDC